MFLKPISILVHVKIGVEWNVIGNQSVSVDIVDQISELKLYRKIFLKHCSLNFDS